MITVKMWKDITGFNPIKDGELDVDGTVKRIADIKGIPIEQIEEMPVCDLLPTFLECVRIVNQEVFKKVDKLAKNAEAGDGQ